MGKEMLKARRASLERTVADVPLPLDTEAGDLPEDEDALSFSRSGQKLTRRARKEIREFLRSDRRALVLSREPKTDVVSQWMLVRNPLRTILSYLIIQTCKLVPWMPLKIFLLRHCLGMRIGRNVGVAPVDFSPLFPELISIGDNSAIGWKATIGCHFFTHSKVILARVRIGRNVLVGALSTILPGVTIGDNAVVTVHSVVDRDIPPGEVWGGVPARRIQKLKKPM